MIAKTIAKLKAFWASMPPFVKIAVVIFVSSATGVIRHALQQPHACMTESCWKGYLFSAAHAGGLAVFFYVMNSPFAKSLPLVPPVPPPQNSISQS